MQTSRTIVEFRTKAFNTTEPKPYFINPGSFGDDLLREVIVKCRELGVKTSDAPKQEDFGWFITFEVEGHEYCLVVGWRPEASAGEGEWIAEIERSRGLVGSLLGRRRSDISPNATSLIHDVLNRLPDVHALAWFRPSASRDVEQQGAPHPNSP